MKMVPGGVPQGSVQCPTDNFQFFSFKTFHSKNIFYVWVYLKGRLVLIYTAGYGINLSS